jgi:hypothetical protein
VKVACLCVAVTLCFFSQFALVFFGFKWMCGVLALAAVCLGYRRMCR